MEGLTVVGWVVSAMVFFGFVALVVIVYAWGIHWLWRERGKGFAEGWFEVAERRARGTAAGALSGVPSSGPAERRDVSLEPTLPLSTPAPEPTKRAPVGPPRYLVPTEKE
jgi:hypothetical protein